MLFILYCTFKYIAHVLDRAVMVKDTYRGYMNFVWYRQEKELIFVYMTAVFPLCQQQTKAKLAVESNSFWSNPL